MCANGPRDRALRPPHRRRGRAAARRRRHRPDHSEAVPEAGGAHRLRPGPVLRLALPARRQRELRLRAQPARGPGRDHPAGRGELRVRLIAGARGVGARRVRLPRDPRPIVRGYLLRELLPERSVGSAPFIRGDRRAAAPLCGRGRSLPAVDRSHGAARRRRRGVRRSIHHRRLPPGDAAARPGRDRAHVAGGRADRCVRTRSAFGGGVVKSYAIAVLPGDGIGPEVTAEAERVLQAAGQRFEITFTVSHFPVGAAAVEAAGDPLPEETRAAVRRANAVLLGAVGSPGLEHAPRHLKPETGLLALRALLGVYANLRPVTVLAPLVDRSPLKPDRLHGVDVLIVRELTGGLYYGEPRGRDGSRAVNTLVYSTMEIERVARVAFDAARRRRRLVTSVDTANVLEVSQLWRETVTAVGREYPDVRLEHLYVDYAAMRLVSEPAAFDVLLTENMFGDILSDEAAVLVGSLGLLPSASLGAGAGLFEPIHGSAPDIAGKGVANPIGAIASVALLLRYGLRSPEAADAVDQAIGAVLDAGARTRDIAAVGEAVIGTREMGERITDLVRNAECGVRSEGTPAHSALHTPHSALE